ncbi:SCRASP1 [Trypoxylus dichotomus]
MSTIGYLVNFTVVVGIACGIYVPLENATITRLGSVGIKTLGWQSNLEHPRISVHHNYSRVYTHQPIQPQSSSYSYNRAYTQQTNRTPKTSLNITHVIDQHLQPPENHSETPQTLHHQQYRLGINDQLGEFSTYHQESTRNPNENPQSYHGSYQIVPQIPNVSLSVKPEKLRLDIHVNPQGTKFVEEEVQVHKVCPPGATGQFVTELSCNQFLNCWKGRGFVQNCAPGTLFNPKTLECDFKEKVTCISGPRETALKQREPLSEALQARCPQGFSGIIPHYTDCSKFINCHNGAEVVMDCAPGTLFDIKSNMCDYPYRALCVGNEKDIRSGHGGGQSQGSSNKIVTIKGYKSNVTYQIPALDINDQLQGFQTHVGAYGGRGGRYHQAGINNHLGEFEVTGQHNQWQGQAPIYIGHLNNTKINFEDQNQPHQKHPQTKQYHQSPICPHGESGLFPHPTRCEKFLNCDHGRTFIQDCGPGTVFNPRFKVCDYPYNVDCQSAADLDEDGYTTENYDQDDYNRNYRMVAALNEAYSMGLQQNYCQGKGPGFSIFPNNCSRFLYCDGEKLFVGICSENMRFNPQKEHCEEDINCLTVFNQYTGGNQQGQSWSTENWQANTQYQDFRLVDIGYEAHTLGLDNKFCQINLGFSVHPRNCSKFLLCVSHAQLLLGICNLHTYYNPSTRTCESTYNCGHIQQGNQWQINTQYQTFRLTEIGYEAHSLGLNNRFCQINPGFSIHPKDCSKFLLCTSNGQLLLGICNLHSYYNPSTKICETTYNCGHLQQGHEFGSAGQEGGSSGQENWQTNSQDQNYRLTDIGFEAYILGLDRKFCQIHPGFSIHPKNCTKFLLCTSTGQLMLGICNYNTYYNPSTKTCESTYDCGHVRQEHQFGTEAQQGNWQTNVQYSSFYLSDIGNEAYVLGLNRRYCQHNPGFSIHPRDCSKFLLCTPDRLLLGICNPNTFYNSSKKTCDSSSTCHHIQQPQTPTYNNQQWQVNQQYEDFYLREAGNEMNMLRLDMSYCLSNDGFSAHPKNCSKFLLCQKGRLMLGICKPQTYFNPSTRRCDASYRCSHIQDGQNNVESSSQEGLNFNYCQIYDGFSEHPINCKQFLYCKYGRLYLGHCKPNLVYNQTLKTCDYNTKCKEIKHLLIQENDIRCHSNEYYSHPTECSKYIKCVKGIIQIQDCVPGTMFNPDEKICDFRYDCDDRLDQSLRQDPKNQWEQTNQLRQNNTDDQWDDQFVQNRDQWEGQYNQNQNQTDQWDQLNQNHTDQWSRWDQNSQWLTTQRPPRERVIDADEDENFVTYDQNKKPTNKWPPPFPSTDPNADYVFEVNDLVEVRVPDKGLKETCQDTDFRCTKTTCIEPRKVCDGSVDCPDGEDEKNCEKYIEEFDHISSTKMAVKEKIKYDNITLTLCAKNCIESKGFVCKAFNFRKMDGACFLLTTNVGLSGSLFILPTYDYYEYRKHSIDCTNKYKCTNQKCIEEHQICDGINDCVDRFDEKGCTAEELGYSVKLVGSGRPYEGAVQVTALGKTGYVCDDMFSLAAANILCKELGFQLGAADVRGNSYFAPNMAKNETFFIMDDVICSGNEVSIKDCDFSGWGVSNCMEKEILGVICRTPEELCATEMWQCEGVTECVPLTFVCDGVDDCSDESDEASKFCDAPLEMRLVEGKTHTEGRVEIKHHGTWGTICDDDLNDDAGKVICRYLGYPGPARIVKEARFGQGSGPIWLDQVFCHGNETSLEDCIRWDWGVHNCDHSEDVGVICSNYNNEEIPRHARIEEDESKSVLPPDRCGYRNDDIFLDNSDVHFRVVESSIARKGHYPWQASLRVKARTSTNHWCGAVVISAKFVLTAAHCLHGFTKGAYVVVAGDYDANEDEGTEQQVFIEEFYIHEGFRKGTKMNNDIALVKLKGNGFNITKDVQPICLPEADFTDEAGLNCTISGFGSVQTGKAVASKELRAGWIPIQSSEICKMPHIYGKTITDGMICAGELDGGTDACDGDSGGPLACLHNGLFTLVGMTSWGQHCGEANKPGVYVKIAHYRNWIDETMKKHA